MTAQEFAPILNLIKSKLGNAIKMAGEDEFHIKSKIPIPGYRTYINLDFSDSGSKDLPYPLKIDIVGVMPQDMDLPEQVEDRDLETPSQWYTLQWDDAGDTVDALMEGFNEWVEDVQLWDLLLKKGEGFDYYQGRWVKTMDMTPTWVNVVEVYINAIEEKSLEDAKKEIRKMAALADERNEILNKLEVAGINWKEL